MNDKRSTPRLRSFLKGRVLFNGGQNSLECLIRDVSSSGARLEVSASVTLPDRFDLYLPHKDETCRVQIQWRRGNQLGIAFEQVENAPTAPPQPQDVATRVRQLETEVELMRMLLAQMKSELETVKGPKPASEVA
jgi:PilZ domain